ncbi:unnamed protein product [Prunus brigantina]
MAALRSFLKKRSTLLCNETVRKRLFSTQASQPINDSPSFAQRVRNLPKDLPGTHVKTEVSQYKLQTVFCHSLCVGHVVVALLCRFGKICFLPAHASIHMPNPSPPLQSCFRLVSLFE